MLEQGCFICQPENHGASDEGCSDCERSYVNEVVIPLGISAGETPPDPWLDYDAAYAQFTAPYRGGVLSEQERQNPRVTLARRKKDAEALLWQLHWAVHDLVGARRWGLDNSREGDRLRKRVVKLFSLLTDEQKDAMRRWDDENRRVINAKRGK